MRFLIVSCVFPPEPVVSSKTSAQVAQALIERGHDVTVITTFPSRPAGSLYPGYLRRLFQRQAESARFELVRCFSILSPESSMVSRFLENISFGLTGGWAALTSRRPDVIYANTWPIFATGILLLVARIRCIPLVVSIQDVYPESLISQERIQADGWLARWMQRVDRLIAHKCRAVIVISETFAAIYRDERGVSPDRLYVVPDWMDSKSIVPDDGRADEFRINRNIPIDAFLAVYGGNVGMAAGVETIVEAFRYLKDIENMYIVIAGEGSSLLACQDLARKIDRRRILFHTPWPEEETSMVLSAADVLVLPTRGRQSTASVPSKLISYMLAARAVIALALPRSDVAEMIERSGCGWVVEPDQPDLLASKIKEVMAMDSTDLAQRGHAGRTFALKNLTRESNLPRLLNILEQAAG